MTFPKTQHCPQCESATAFNLVHVSVSNYGRISSIEPDVPAVHLFGAELSLRMMFWCNACGKGSQLSFNESKDAPGWRWHAPGV